ncbi:hypothetical protein QZM46_08405 [Burkholderia vietnamiensis]|jgi:hypothetical protein|uniref:Apea-like HEPN domain-containing protein n=1 Tax=Burkholderia vietnamiensis TaxID=60552 RepID=A0AAW7SZR2_BURVI|nr:MULTISPECIES: hypothetical protein [Burkholderia]ABX19360.1 hypothetical protein Bmul_5695 [Burkholderia multivorans ATCC 17616]MBH9646546.1 hypothetical protein [Burkholderia vietnamiensis]MBR7913123.1 hypothetical protein [Burkholderia vietnamiensis]MBR8003414.1 hypothetical protein [Burkholderia vietnamiensis]MBR8009134.1 hypothetical protein [Burkholderia vietnamiensis]
MDKVSKAPVIDGIDLSLAMTWSRHQQFAAYSGQVVRAHRYIEDLMDVLLKDFRLRVCRNGKPTLRPTYHEKYKCLNRHWAKKSQAGRWVWEAVRLLNDCRNEMAHGVSRSDAPPWRLARAQLKRYVEYVEKHGPDVVEPAAGVLPAGTFNTVTVVLALSIQRLALAERRAILQSDEEPHQRDALRALFE